MIHLDEKDSITILRMEHGKVNAMDIEFCNTFLQRLDEMESGPTKAVVITGTGSTFSAGIDLFRLLKEDASYTLKFLETFAAFLTKVFLFPKPIIAAVNGHAIAGGCILSCACDYKLMAAGSGKIGIPEVLVGVPFPTLALEIVKSTIPTQHCQASIYLGKTFGPNDALNYGFVNEVVSSEWLMKHASAIAENLGRIPPTAFITTKNLLRKPAMDYVNAEGVAVDTEVVKIWQSHETREHIRAYLEKTLKKKKK